MQRQGLNAAILDHESPLNTLEDVPNSGGKFNCSPMWDIHLVQWNDSVSLPNRVRQTDFARAEALVGTQAQSISAWGALSNTFPSSRFIVNCPLMSIFGRQPGRRTLPASGGSSRFSVTSRPGGGRLTRSQPKVDLCAMCGVLRGNE